MEGLLVQAVYKDGGKRGSRSVIKTKDATILAGLFLDALNTKLVLNMELYCLASKIELEYLDSLIHGYALDRLLLETLPTPSRDFVQIGSLRIRNQRNIEKFGITFIEYREKPRGIVPQVKSVKLSVVRIF